MEISLDPNLPIKKSFINVLLHYMGNIYLFNIKNLVVPLPFFVGPTMVNIMTDAHYYITPVALALHSLTLSQTLKLEKRYSDSRIFCFPLKSNKKMDKTTKNGNNHLKREFGTFGKFLQFGHYYTRKHN